MEMTSAGPRPPFISLVTIKLMITSPQLKQKQHGPKLNRERNSTRGAGAGAQSEQVVVIVTSIDSCINTGPSIMWCKMLLLRSMNFLSGYFLSRTACSHITTSSIDQSVGSAERCSDGAVLRIALGSCS